MRSKIQEAGAEMDAKTELRIKKDARKVYFWLLLSPFFTVPCMVIFAIAVSYRPDFVERVGVVTAPLIFQLPLLIWLNSPNYFVKRHAQQGFILVALRFLSALLLIAPARYFIDNLGWFLLVNGALWLLGSLWGLYQAGRGGSTLMVWMGETELLPGHRNISDLKRDAKNAASDQKAVRAGGSAAGNRADEARGKLQIGKNLLAFESRDMAVRNFAEAFRDGDQATRQQALSFLDELGEVEEF